MFVGLCGGSESIRRLCAETLMREFAYELLHMDKDSWTSILDHVTGRWQENFVALSVTSMAQLEELSRRPFFLLVNIQDPTHSAQFDITQIQLQAKSAIILCHSGTLQELQSCIKTCLAPALLAKLARPEWDAYFLRIAEFSARRTNCMKRGVGAVLVLDKTIIATGYNGTARGTLNCMDGGCRRCNSSTIRCGQALDSCLCLHAEENAMIEAGRTRARGATLYTTTSPCLSCAKKICQVGIERVVFSQNYSMDHFSAELFEQAGIVMEQKQAVSIGPLVISSTDLNCAQMQRLTLSPSSPN